MDRDRVAYLTRRLQHVVQARDPKEMRERVEALIAEYQDGYPATAALLRASARDWLRLLRRPCPSRSHALGMTAVLIEGLGRPSTPHPWRNPPTLEQSS